jgi:hypothetical protein
MLSAARRLGGSAARRLGGSANHDPRCDLGRDRDLPVKQHRPLAIGVRRWVGNRIKRRARLIEVQLARGVLQKRRSCTSSETRARSR